METRVLAACLPWLPWLGGAAVLLVLLLRAARPQPDLRRLRRLHGDQTGGVQSLSFVLTLPLLLMVVMLIVQISQLMIGTIVVHYAAFAAGRAAAVWIPAATAGSEQANCISSYFPDPDAAHQAPPPLDPAGPDYGPSAGGTWWVIRPESPKGERIRRAAALACVPIAPSRDTGADLSADDAATAAVLQEAYVALGPARAADPRTARRLRNKLAYALAHTEVHLRFFHSNAEPPLVPYYLAGDPGEFRFNEIGWQDPVTVTVRHHFALLPGPGRLLARYLADPGGEPDSVSGAIDRRNGIDTVPLSASVTLGNEGKKSVIPYVHVIP